MTRYHLRAKVLTTKQIVEEAFDSMTERELWKAGYGAYARILAEWQTAEAA